LSIRESWLEPYLVYQPPLAPYLFSI
jgi:hypothetical protein